MKFYTPAESELRDALLTLYGFPLDSPHEIHIGDRNRGGVTMEAWINGAGRRGGTVFVMDKARSGAFSAGSTGLRTEVSDDPEARRPLLPWVRRRLVDWVKRAAEAVFEEGAFAAADYTDAEIEEMVDALWAEAFGEAGGSAR